MNKRSGSYYPFSGKKKYKLRYLFLFLYTIAIPNLFSQIQEAAYYSSSPNQMEVRVTQPLSFGSFSPGFSGGDIIVSPYGNRTVTGTIVAFPDMTPLPARFEVRLIPNRIVHIVLPTDATLTHTEGKGKMTVTNFTTDKAGNTFITTQGSPFINPVYIGATLKVQSLTVNPPGNYRGTFTVTFVQE
jgi:hypothetical protein